MKGSKENSANTSEFNEESKKEKQSHASIVGANELIDRFRVMMKDVEHEDIKFGTPRIPEKWDNDD